jgi:hypothetical protein
VDGALIIERGTLWDLLELLGRNQPQAASLPTHPETRHQTIPPRDRHRNPAFVASFRRRRPGPYERGAAILRHFERDPIPYTFETDWLVGAAEFEPLYQEPCPIGPTAIVRREEWRQIVRRTPAGRAGLPSP